VVTLVSGGLVDTSSKAYAAGERFAEERRFAQKTGPPLSW